VAGDLIPVRLDHGADAPFGEKIANTLAKYRRLGGTPAISPKIIIQAPIWNDPQIASRYTTRTRSWRNWRDNREEEWRVETINVLSEHQDSIPAGGLLRFQDLDVTMALALYRTRSGSRDIEIDQTDLLHAMGYDDLSMASYPAIRGSLRRMLNTKVAIYRSGQRYGDTDSWQIIDEAEVQAGHQLCRPSRLHARLGRIWDDALASDTWQAVDLNGYFLLARKLRREGLARVIYLYLSSWRDRDGCFDVPAIAIIERFAQRRVDRRYRFTQPFVDPRSSLYRALKGLVQHGVIRFAEDIDAVPLAAARLRGKFQVVPDQFDSEPRQLVLFKPSAWDPTVVATIAVETDSPQDLTKTEEHHEHTPEDTWDALQDAYCEETIQTLLDRYDPPLARKRLAVARSAGWTVRQLWLASGQVLWLHLENRSVSNPAGYLSRILTNGIEDSVYRAGFSKKNLMINMNIAYHDWLRWMLAGPLREFPPPRRPIPSQETT